MNNDTSTVLADSPVADRRHCGAVALPNGSVRWRVWAPKTSNVNLLLLDPDGRQVIPMEPEAGGYFVLERAGVAEGQRYKICIDGFECRPDPASLWQPD